MIAHVFMTPEETAQKYLWLCRLSDGWRIYACEINGVTVYGVSYNVRDFIAMVRKRCIMDARQISLDELPKPSEQEVEKVEQLEKRYEKPKRKVSKKKVKTSGESRIIKDTPEHKEKEDGRTDSI
jgi:hypothetical protein